MGHRGTVRGYPVINIVMGLHLLTICVHDFAFGEKTQNPLVEGFEGRSVILPCTLTGTGVFEWRRGTEVILVTGTPGIVTFPNSQDLNVFGLVDGNNLEIFSLKKTRDDGRVFTCSFVGSGDEQETRVRVLAGNDGMTVPTTSTSTTASTTDVATSTLEPRTTTSTIATTAGSTPPVQTRQSVVTDVRSSPGKSPTPTKSTKIPDDGATAGQELGSKEKSVNVGAVVGGTVTAVVIIVIGVAVVVVWYRKKGCPKSAASPSRQNNAGCSTDDLERTASEGRVYEELSENPDYANTGMDQPYDTMQQTAFTSQSKETQMEDQASYEKINPPVYWNTDGAVYEAVKPVTR